ncbi:hypothetical protein ESCO_006024 [Escovopsis weberi]|uniref:Uncharacterized protein n=1 Tax=Escovopsis weberi TaxID=150374 RepID=A0A0N0RSX9_ESCWE|nr:hypothetical protein ESCO_006024 [Escovopsis weberi]
MASRTLFSGLFALSFASVGAQKFRNEDLILCDCGIGDNRQHSDWSTSRQMNWYKDISWPDSAYKYPDAPDMAVEIPFKEGIYPWVSTGATATFPNGEIWTAYIEDGTPDGFKAGSAVTTKEGGQILNCWAYRGRPVSAAINKTANADAICWTAFVCNRDDHPPPRPADMGAQTSTLTTQSVAPSTTFFSAPPSTASPTGGQPVPTSSPHVGELSVYSTVSPRFINWQSTWGAFINNFVWDQTTGNCIGDSIRGQGYSINVTCAGVRIDQDTHMTLLMIKALRDVGLKSLWFNQNPTVPSNNGTNATSSWVVMPESFTLKATDLATNKVVGHLSYSTQYDGFLTGPCTACETARFNSDFFNPIIAAVQGSYPVFNNFTISAQCYPWMVCK